MDESRRSFLKGIGVAAAAAGLGCTFPLLRALASSGTPAAGVQTRQLCMVIDIEKCLNEDLIKDCTEACRIEHNLPGGESDPERQIRWMWTQKFEHTFPDQAHSLTPKELRGEQVPVMCNHCTNPACVKVCPTKATWKRESDGVVMMDMHRCIGCRYCVVGCPYGARSFNWHEPRPHIKNIRPEYPTRMRGVVEKCTFCAERLREGREPACVEAANRITEGAMTFGELSDPNSKVSALLKTTRTISRQNALGTGPNVYYIV
ncbi:MAG: 4Fe-4S dicluster domain-containing protein [Planctomycetota bacterium]|nr:MAG: 4Fe-4S dicluster domain-containing protein [Planctomycetota bacterium]